jgi:hypothetical protein
MNRNDWWALEEHKIAKLNVDDRHVEFLYGREMDGSWEYAIVSWRHKQPDLRYLFRNGQMIETNE